MQDRRDGLKEDLHKRVKKDIAPRWVVDLLERGAGQGLVPSQIGKRGRGRAQQVTGLRDRRDGLENEFKQEGGAGHSVWMDRRIAGAGRSRAWRRHKLKKDEAGRSNSAPLLARILC